MAPVHPPNHILIEGGPSARYDDRVGVGHGTFDVRPMAAALVDSPALPTGSSTGPYRDHIREIALLVEPPASSSIAGCRILSVELILTGDKETVIWGQLGQARLVELASASRGMQLQKLLRSRFDFSLHADREFP